MAKGRGERCFVGVDLGGTNIQAGVLDPKNRLLCRMKNRTRAEEGSGAVVGRIVKTVEEAISEAGLKPTAIGGLGIGAPGTIDPERGVVQLAVNLRWRNFPLAKALSDRLKLPVVADNDVNVGTWGEKVLGAGRGYDDLLGVFAGTGIGGGVVLGGRLYRGHFLTAGEIGHTIIHADAQLGRRTLENCASRTAIANLIAQLIRASHSSSITRTAGFDLNDIRSKAIAKAVQESDPLVCGVVQKAAEYVGTAIANVVTVMSLPCVVLGGGVTEALGKRWADWVRKSFEERVFPPDLKACKIMAGTLGDDAGVIGAALLARDYVLAGVGEKSSRPC